MTLERQVRNVHRSLGALFSGELVRRHPEGLPDDTIQVRLQGIAGQSFGAFGARGLTLRLEGQANDYTGKGLSGARLIVRPPAAAAYPESSIAIGNTSLYGATGGELLVRGVAGERFAVRNSGAAAVVEGVGDHGCEYMTGGTVVVLGPAGRNFAAGMSGGLAFLYDPSGASRRRVNGDLVGVGPVEDEELLRTLVQRHADETGSPLAAGLLASWEVALAGFVQVTPHDVRRLREETIETTADEEARA